MKKIAAFLLAIYLIFGSLQMPAFAATNETDFTPFKITVTRTGAPQDGYKRLLVKNEFGFEPSDNQLKGCLLNGTVTYTGSADFSKSVPLKDVEVIAQPLRSDGTISLDFKVPDNWFDWQPSAYHGDGVLNDLAQRFIDAESDEDLILYIFGHSYEIEAWNAWDRMEEFFKFVSGREGITYATNIEIKDYICGKNK